MRIILITEQALRKAVPNAKQRVKLRASAIFKANVNTLGALIKKLFSDVDFSGMENKFSGTGGEDIPEMGKTFTKQHLEEIYPGIIASPLPAQSKYAGRITLKNCDMIDWLDYNVLLNPTKEIKITEYDAVDIGDLAHISQFSPPPFNHKAQEILNKLKLEYYARTENDSEVN